MTGKTSKFMNMWEIDSHFKCPVTGAILSVEKHRDILKKCGYDVSGLKSYEYHQIIMSKLDDENEVSVKVNNVIRARARKWMQMIEGMDKKEMRKLWNDNLESGQVGPLMFAIVAYEDADFNLLQDVYGEVHMKAHANMTGIFEVRKALANNRAALDREKNKLKLKAGENKALVKLRKENARRITGLETENARLKRQVTELEQRVMPEPEADNAVTRELEMEIRDIRSELESSAQALLDKDRQLHPPGNRFFYGRTRGNGTAALPDRTGLQPG